MNIKFWLTKIAEFAALMVLLSSGFMLSVVIDVLL